MHQAQLANLQVEVEEIILLNLHHQLNPKSSLNFGGYNPHFYVKTDAQNTIGKVVVLEMVLEDVRELKGVVNNKSR
jgi:hypothetical protein